MCDCLVALAANTLHGATLFAKNSDRPPAERQDFVWVPSRVDKGPVRTTHIAIEPHDGPTLSCALSVPSWCWGAEHGVNEAGVAVLADIHFGARVPDEGQHIRFSYAASNEAIEAGIARMAAFVRENTRH